MRPDVVRAVMRAEMRLTRRLVRYWVFLSLALISGLGIFLYYCSLHAFFSSHSGTAAAIGPRFLIGAMGLYYVGFFLFGLVFMAFDVRARDVRERMVEVLDARPMTTPELLTGRFLAQLAAAWVPAWVMVGLMQLLGFGLPALGAPIGQTIQPASLVMFTVFMCLPAMVFSLGLTYLVTLLVRHRLIAAVLCVGILVGLIWASFRVSPLAAVFFDVSGLNWVYFPSDLLPGLITGIGLLQRAGFIVAGLAFLTLAVAVHPRLDGGSRSRRAAVGAGLFVVSLGLWGWSSGIRAAELRRQDTWLGAHEARSDELRPDVVSVRASVTVDPGDRLSVEAEMTVAAPAEGDLDHILLTLNPGLEVEEITVDGEAVPFDHSDGLLTIDLPMDMPRTLRLRYSGKPDIGFGYLDAVRTPERMAAKDAQLYILGYDRGINDRRYVALMPGIAWLPISGSAVESRDDGGQGPDFFNVDLEVTLPDDWLAAGPGARKEIGRDGDRVTYAFAPGAPVDGVAVLASRFETYAVDIDGVRMELLLSPRHSRLAESLADAADPIRRRISDLLEEFAEAGLPYPYDGFTMVEAPNALRGFGGGWRLGSVLGQPGVMIVRELGFPLARFDVPFRDESKWQDHEGGIPQAKLERVEKFFIDDFSGGNLFAGAARSFFLTECSTRGPGREALDWSFDELGTLLLSGSRGYFSAHLYSSKMNARIGEVIQTYLFSRNRGHFADAVIAALTSKPGVWEAVLDLSPVDFDPWEDPQRTIDALSLKSGTLAQIVYNDLGFDGSAAFLGDLRQAFAGGTFTLADVVAAASERNPALGRMIEDLMTTTALPGLTAEPAEVFRLPDGEGGEARYQLRVVVQNGEAAPGQFRIAYTVGEAGERSRETSDPIPIEGHGAVRFATVLTRPPAAVRIEPYLSLNRRPFRVDLPEFDEETIVETDPEEGVTPVEPVVVKDPAVIVDDLDESFEIVGGDGRSGLRLGARQRADDELDEGLPGHQYAPAPKIWSRGNAASAYGHYRHTFAWKAKGKGESRARMTAVLLEPGTWELAVHLPHKDRFPFVPMWGTWKLIIEQDGDRREVDFDSKEAGVGWNVVDTFDLGAGEVTVEFSDATTGMIVVADAVRWTPVAGGGSQ